MIALVGRCWPFISYNYETCFCFLFVLSHAHEFTLHFSGPISSSFYFQKTNSSSDCWSTTQIGRVKSSGLHNSWLLLLISLTEHHHFLEPCCRIQGFITWIIIIQSSMHFTVACFLNCLDSREFARSFKRAIEISNIKIWLTWK